MQKKILSLIIITLLLSGCFHNNSGKVKLNKEYYNDGSFIKVSSNQINKLKNDVYILYTYNNFCTFQIPCEDIFSEFMKKRKIDFLSISFEEFRNTYLYDTVKYAPSVIIVSNGNIIAYLDANSDDDLDKYQDSSVFEKWIGNYIKSKNR